MSHHSSLPRERTDSRSAPSPPTSPSRSTLPPPASAPPTSPPPSVSPSPESVRRSLRALADGTGTEGDCPESESTACEAERTVREADRAVSCAREAAAFLGDGRLPALESAVESAARCDAAALERRGRRALATLRRLDTALSGAAGEDTCRVDIAGDADIAEDVGATEATEDADDTRSMTDEADRQTTSAPLAERF